MGWVGFEVGLGLDQASGRANLARDEVGWRSARRMKPSGGTGGRGGRDREMDMVVGAWKPSDRDRATNLVCGRAAAHRHHARPLANELLVDV